MNRIFTRIFWKVVCACICIMIVGCHMETSDSTSVKALFADPPVEYSSAPFWVWNDMLTEEQVISTLRDFAGQGIKQAIVHPRPGLMTPYLSDDWFRLWKIALKEAQRLKMNLWIYDENSYPSGFAGGFVPEAMPEAREQRLVLAQEKQPPQWSEDIIAVYHLNGDRFKEITQKIRSAEKMPESRYLVASVQRAKNSSWYGGKFYVDLLYPGVTEKFLAITLEPYRQQFGEQFGKRIPGVFTDEPRLWRRRGGLHWTGDLPDAFRKRWGYSLIDNLPSLFKPIGDWKRVRHNYFQVLLELFTERWGKPYYNYCRQYGLELTGHYWEHEWPRCTVVPDNMAMYAWQQRPGIDNLQNRYSESTRAQFGNIRSVKELSSVANQLGRKRTLCEAYGASGWDMRFEDMKRIGDWLFVLGVNTLNQHLSFVSMRGVRKGDYPPSFSYHEPWWDSYHIMEKYFSRLTAALCQGEQINKVLVIEPTTTVWMYQVDPNHKEQLMKIGDEFQQLVVAMAKAQVEFDIGSEYIIAEYGSMEGTLFNVGQRQYDTIVLPPLTENLNAKTMELIEAYAKGGGKVLCCGVPPAMVDGVPSESGRAASQSDSWKQVETADIPEMLLRQLNDGFAIHRPEDDKGILLHHRRQLDDDNQLLFLTNTSIDSPTLGVVESTARGVQQWNLTTDPAFSSYPFETTEHGIKADFELPPCGSLLLFLSTEPVESADANLTETVTIAPVESSRIRRIKPNVLTIDYVDIAAGGETNKSVYYSKASLFAFQKNGLDRNPWDHAVQFRDELIRMKFPPESGLEATYHFTIEGQVPQPLYIVIERPQLYTITCNETSVSASKSSWWLDRAFGKIDITSAAKVGKNAVTIKASPFTVYHEVAAAYLLGDFALKAADGGFVIVPQTPLDLGPWDKQGYPFYGAAVSYSQSFDIQQPAGRYYVRLPDWYGSVARVTVNGKEAGHIFHQPWECDITECITAGRNEIEVVVFGTLKNTLGPHHGKVRLGAASPGSFRKGPEPGPPPGDQYHTVGYGLFKPFELHRR